MGPVQLNQMWNSVIICYVVTLVRRITDDVCNARCIYMYVRLNTRVALYTC